MSRPGSLTLCSRRTHRKHLDLSPVLADPEKLRCFISGAVEADAALTEKSTAPSSQIELRQIELRTHRMPPGRAHTANPGTAQGAVAARGSEERSPLGALAVRTENRNEGFDRRRKVFRLAYPNQSSEPATISIR